MPRNNRLRERFSAEPEVETKRVEGSKKYFFRSAGPQKRTAPAILCGRICLIEQENSRSAGRKIEGSRNFSIEILQDRNYLHFVQVRPVRRDFPQPSLTVSEAMTRYNVLIIDHDADFLAGMKKTISRLNHGATCMPTISEGLQAALHTPFDIVVMNSEPSDSRAIEVLRKIREIPSPPEVVVVSDSGDPDEAEAAIRNGAWDYAEKPKGNRGMALLLVRLFEYLARKGPARDQRQVLKKETYEEIVGSSPAIRTSLDLVAMAAESEANVLIGGETGTGKELFAWAIHNNSKRANQQFVVVDCAALPPTLVESTLFGYEKGAFTGADRPHKGLIKRADGGTLFLDEVGELPLPIQRSFLRVLQERSFRLVGSNKETRSEFRLIAATNRNLEQMVQRRQFRKDLLFRLKAFSMELPPLRDRIQDIREIAVHQMTKLCRSYNCAEKSFSLDFFETLSRYEWPGNVRELVNAIERAISAARNEPVIFPKHLPTYIRIDLARASAMEDEAARPALETFTGNNRDSWPRLAQAREAAVAHAERDYLKALIASTGKDIKKAIGISGLSRSRFYALLKKHRISVSDAEERG